MPKVAQSHSRGTTGKSSSRLSGGRVGIAAKRLAPGGKRAVVSAHSMFSLVEDMEESNEKAIRKIGRSKGF
ncbi:hypothetical protein QWY16_09965 [Planococcus shenhongbingii]|uniref:Uncharacterized protein n=1 Tax=Planococcus shenhongbingii TaxID=3058398 RepID=A0ABT8NGC4_9BACL|nr:MULTISPECIES: hypothetical protein [unclassified Planococcus (in: firmicutes)]MDN7246939.1 hypothetical protein [Planococcus sp. N017]WKA56842.1 hypothetical protein QWY16_09965 [Planococcus sp. N016]